jgi:coproporphyrinogen III oxidase
MVRSLVRRLLGRPQDNGSAGGALELPPEDSRRRARAMVMGLQDEICAGLESLDGEGTFVEESWERPEGGGGRSRVMREGRVFEQGGVNFSEVQGQELPPSILKQRPEAKGHPWFATGTSMVLHPRNPYIPTVHLNYRYFEAGPVWWFGGGADLTPYYPFLEDARHFHRTHQAACDSIHPDLHKVFKPWCDEYFFLKHRGETRGVGGIFYDYQDSSGVLYKGQDPSAGSNSSPWGRPTAVPFSRPMRRLLRSGIRWLTAIASVSSSFIAAGGMWSSTWSGTEARSSACRPTGAPNRS